MLADFREFCRIPSISTLPAHKEDVARCARWVAARMRRAGLENVAVLSTAGHPVVYGDWLHAPGRPTVLMYAHYDVQPVDPVDQWVTPPFSADVRDGHIWARGASDDKSGVYILVAGVERVLREDGRLPVNVKFLIEGEEEVGSRSLPALLQAERERFAADFATVTDGMQWAPGVPAICYGLRGGTGVQVDVYGAKQDLHSGLFGGAVQNPVRALVQLLATLHHPDGRVAVEGFYDGVRPLSEAERREMAALADDERFRQEAGVEELFGEPGYSTLERVGARPTLEFTGIYGGFQGEGGKTIVPAEAHAKISCRLVPDQDPADVQRKLVAHLEKHKPPAVKLVIQALRAGTPAVLTPRDHPAVLAGAKALAAVFGRDPVFMRMGGGIPVVNMLQTYLGQPSLIWGFGQQSDNFHSPNEHFAVESLEMGVRTVAAYLRLL